MNIKTSRLSKKKKDSWKNYQLFIAIFIVIIIVVSGIYALTADDNQRIDAGENFLFTLLNGEKEQLKSFRGKIVILDMWATWCSPCQMQMIELEKAYNNHSREELEILSINIDPREGAQDIEEFIAAFDNYGYDLAWIFGMEDENLDGYMPSGSIPTLCIFDQKGNLYYSHTGLIFYANLPQEWTGERVTLLEKIDELIK